MRIGKRTDRRLWSGAAVAGLLGVLAVALLAWLVAVPAIRVEAANFNVNVTGDGADANPGDGACDDGAGNCTLRAAIGEANATPDTDVIIITTGAAIALGGALPAITDNDLQINGSGRQVSMTAGGPAFTIGADRVNIANLIIDGEGIGTEGVVVNANADDLVLDGVTVRDFTSNGIRTATGGKRNTIRGCSISGNGDQGIDLNGGEDNSVQDSVISNNGNHPVDAGVEVWNEDDLLIQGNSFSGNDDDQISIASLQAGQDVTIIQNTITAGSDGIQVDGLVSATADIDIGLTFDNRNVFRGAITAPGEQHLRNLSAANIEADYNDWDAYNAAAIEGVICHNGEPPACGAGVVDFEPFVDVASPLPTATPTPGAETPTPTPTLEAETPTPTPSVPGELESVPLIAGCNPAASTYPDGTPIETIADAVTPEGNLTSLWEFEAGFWLGYSPFYPEVSDLTEKDFLDVVFICVDAAGTFERPLI